jgi:hypothetical protein
LGSGAGGPQKFAIVSNGAQVGNQPTPVTISVDTPVTLTTGNIYATRLIIYNNANTVNFTMPSGTDIETALGPLHTIPDASLTSQ